MLPPKNNRLIKYSIFIVLFITVGYADSPEFRFPPPDYLKTCESYQKLHAAGKTVKADRLAKTYRAKFLDPIFVMKPKEKRIIKFVSDYGLFTGMTVDVDLGYTFWSDSKCQSKNPDFAIEFVKVPTNKLESWQNLIAKWFPDDEADIPRLLFVEKDNNRCSGTGKMLSEITIDFDYYPDFKPKYHKGFVIQSIETETISIAEDCFSGKWANSIHFTNTTDLRKTLRNYKLIDRIKVLDEASELALPETNENNAVENSNE